MCKINRVMGDMPSLAKAQKRERFSHEEPAYRQAGTKSTKKNHRGGDACYVPR